jgi:predicted O-methyltransferase YrrM
VKIEEAVGYAEQIDGWMETAELVQLGEWAAEHKTIVEVGAWQGRSTKVMALMTPGTVHVVDNFKGEVDRPVPDLRDLFLANAEPNVVLHEGTSAEAIWDWPHPRRVDMIFVDANHEYPHPLQDILLWKPFLKSGGLICGHDISAPGVTQSLDELGREHKQVMGSIWRLT